ASRWQPLPLCRILRFGPAIPYISDAQWSEGLDALSALPLHGIGCLFPDEILYLCTSETDEMPPTVTEAIRHICRKYHFRCGISDPFSHLLEVSRYRNQPRLALQLSSEELCFYKDVRFANLKQHFRSYATPDDLIHPAILRLQQLDGETGSEYLKTLRALFENQYSQVGAALSLGIHRTTLFYRLQRIEDLTGIRLNDADEMLHLQLSLLLCVESL
ncbi:MAG: helix-turn-helix domain-containing protein, partial [Lachnospiraceae bacterium]|nr:helix-turn-helix domain-containing protein [Lachnospiraceae bacterium]